MEDTIALTIWSHWKKQMETRRRSSIMLIDTQKTEVHECARWRASLQKQSQEVRLLERTITRMMASCVPT